jgi:hypothetical protein
MPGDYQLNERKVLDRTGARPYHGPPGRHHKADLSSQGKYLDMICTCIAAPPGVGCAPAGYV